MAIGGTTGAPQMGQTVSSFVRPTTLLQNEQNTTAANSNPLVEGNFDGSDGPRAGGRRRTRNPPPKRERRGKKVGSQIIRRPWSRPSGPADEILPNSDRLKPALARLALRAVAPVYGAEASSKISILTDPWTTKR